MVRCNSQVVIQSVSDVGVLDKAMAILNALEQGPLALAGLVDATGYHRATAHRLATALEVHGMVRRNGEGRFVLGGRLVELGRVAVNALPLRDAARPALERLVAVTGESAQLYVREGDHRICVDAVESPHGLRTIVAVGAVLPLDRGSAGKVLLGGRDVLARGWAESAEEREPGVASVSAPIRDLDGDVRAAISVSGPIERTGRRPGSLYSAAVRKAAATVERAAGWSQAD